MAGRGARHADRHRRGRPHVTRLTIVIVAFNAREDLAGTLLSLTTTSPSTSEEVVGVDTASTDGSPGLVRARFPGVSVIEAGENLGFSRANNLAIRRSASELVLLLTPDTIVPAGAIDQLVACLDSQPEVAVVGPRIVDANGRAE